MWIHVYWELDWDQIILRWPWTSINCFTAGSHFWPRSDSLLLSINQRRILQLRIIAIKMSDDNIETCPLKVWLKNTHRRPLDYFFLKENLFLRTLSCYWNQLELHVQLVLRNYPRCMWSKWPGRLVCQLRDHGKNVRGELVCAGKCWGNSWRARSDSNYCFLTVRAWCTLSHYIGHLFSALQD